MVEAGTRPHVQFHKGPRGHSWKSRPLTYTSSPLWKNENRWKLCECICFRFSCGCEQQFQNFPAAKVTWKVPGNTDCWSPPPEFEPSLGSCFSISSQLVLMPAGRGNLLPETGGS